MQHNMQKKSFHLVDVDAHSIPLYEWLPDKPPTCILHIAHCMAEYAERCAPIAEMLAQ